MDVTLRINYNSTPLYNVSVLFRITIKLSFFKSREHINEKGGVPYRDFGYISLFSDPIDLATWS